MTTRTATPCTFCHGRLLLQVGDETIVCPAHAELHDDQGRPTFTAAQIATGEITIDDPTPSPYSLGLRLVAIVAASLTLWALAVLAVLNPSGFAWVLGVTACIWFALVGDQTKKGGQR